MEVGQPRIGQGGACLEVFMPCFFVVSIIEVPGYERKYPEFFSLIFSLRMPRPDALLTDGMDGIWMKLKI